MSDVDEMIREANAKRARRLPLVAIVLPIVALPFLFIGYAYWSKHRAEHRDDLDGDGRKELANALDAADLEIANREARYRAVVIREKLAAIEPSGSPCPVDAPEPFSFTRANAPVPRGDVIAQLASRSSETRKRLAEGRATRTDLRTARAIASPDTWSDRSDTLLFVDEVVEARMARDPDTQRIGFIAGRIVGRAWVYSYGEGRIVCAGLVEGRSSPTIEVKYQSTSISPTLEDPGTFLARTEAEKSKLWDDLVSQTNTAAKKSLRLPR